MSTSTVALTIEMPSLDASLSWNALESLVVGMSHEVPARALALALDDAQERLLQEACGPRWAPVRGLLAPFTCPGCGAREDFARKGKRTRPVSYTHLRAPETPEQLVCRLLLEKKKQEKI